MASVLAHQDRVLYSCSCSQLSTLAELFFCRHCKLPRCQDCVSSTIESFSCPHCFEAAMTDALKSKKGRCTRCFQCPQCFTTLTTRSVLVPGEVQGDQVAQKGDKQRTVPGKSPGGTKLYYLSCSHCKWSTRDVGIKDKRSPIDFKDRPSPNQPRFDALVSFYKDYAVSDNALREKTKKSISGRRSQRMYSSLLDPTKFSKVTGSESPPTRRGSSQLAWNEEIVDKMAAVAGDPKPPPDDLYAEDLDLEQIPSLEQKLKDPMFQPQLTKDLAPSQLRLTGKKLHRCKGCEHILMKAELNLNSIRFKIQQAAMHSFPQVRIVEARPLSSQGSSGSTMEAVLSITNPLNYAVTLSFSQVDPKDTERVKETLSSVSVPEGEYFLSPNDDVLEFLEGDGGESDIKDDPQFVEQRLPGKLFLKFQVTPSESTDGKGTGGKGSGGKRVVRIMFRMTFTHKSTVEADQDGGSCNVTVPIMIRLLRPKSV